MNQRVMIAMAIACNPKLLIADEPTTALDVTIQAQILDLLLKLQRETGMGLVLITHSMGVVAETAERVRVQYAGQKVEEQPVRGLFADPHHPYTAALLAALPERAEWPPPALHPGRRPRPVRPAARLPVLAALPLCHGSLPRSNPAAPAPRAGDALCHYPLIARHARRAIPGREERRMTRRVLEATEPDPLLSRLARRFPRRRRS